MLVFLMHYWFCLQNGCLELEERNEFFLALYWVMLSELFDFLFYNNIIDDGKKKITSRVLKLQVPPNSKEEVPHYFFELLKIEHIYHLHDAPSKKEIEHFKESEEGWICYEAQNDEVDYVIALNTYMEYTTLWTKLLSASREGYTIWIQEEQGLVYDVIEGGKVLTGRS